MSVSNKNITKKRDIKNTKNEVLRIRLNKDRVIMAKKAKFMEKSQYFRSITKSCFADHKSYYTEVAVPVNFEIFKKVVDWIMTDHIEIEDDEIFDIYKVSDYLLIESLSRFCLDHFIYNLNKKHLDYQLSVIEKQPLIFRDFREIAMKFKESCQPCVKGLYLLDEHEHLLKIMSEGHEYELKYRMLNEPENKIKFGSCSSRSSLIIKSSFSNSLIIRKVEYSSECDPLLLQYDLITGKMYHIDVKYTIYSVVCSDNENLYVITPVENKKAFKFSISLLSKAINDVTRWFCKTKTFSLPHSDYPNYEKGSYDCYKLRVCFSFSDNKTLSICYELFKWENEKSFLYRMYLFTICIKTMNVLSNKRLSECIKFGTDGPHTQREYIEKITHYDLEVIFTLKRNKKVVIEVWFNLFLVFDANEEMFYFVKDVVPKTLQARDTTYSLCGGPDYTDYTIDKNDTVYMYKFYDKVDTRWGEIEIRTFDYRNDKLVETGTIWRHSFRLYSSQDLFASVCAV